MQKFISAVLIAAGAFSDLPAQTLSRERVLIETPYGNMTVGFYEETPVHKSNFLKLVEQNFFDSLLFHRVINDFMIQGGDPLSRTAKPGDSLGHGDIGYTLPAEIRPGLVHKKGALCAARESDDVNPGFASSASQFYIVMGKPRSPDDLLRFEERIDKAHYANCARAFAKTETGQRLKRAQERLLLENKPDSARLVNDKMEALVCKEHFKKPRYRFSPAQKALYAGLGGTPHLDNTYTVFGEVTEGLEVIDKIAAVRTDQRNRPMENVPMKMTVISR